MTPKSLSSVNALSVSGHLDLTVSKTELVFADGRVLYLPTALLVEETPAPALPEVDSTVIPLLAEQLEIGKRVVETGKVKLNKSVEAYEVELDEALAMKTWQIERVAKHEVVLQAPSTRQEGDTTVYPVVQERLVLTKELVLIEEVHVTAIVSERRDTQTVTLHREMLNVEREASEKR